MSNPIGRMDWPILFLYNGVLMDEDGECATRFAPIFSSVEQAEKWLVDNDVRGNVLAGRRRGDHIIAKGSDR